MGTTGDLVVTEFITLDGVVEAPGGEPSHPHSGWVQPFFDDGVGAAKFQEVVDAEVNLLGRVTYESFAGAWPQRDDDFAKRLNPMPKYVVTATLSELEWENSTILEGDLVEAVTKLKEDSGGSILVSGSRTLVQGLLKADLVDELRLMVFPVVLGSGDRLFPDDSPDMLSMSLAESETFDTGVQLNVFRRTR